jgi:hypothetical protein
VPGIFQDAQIFLAEMKNFSSAYMRVPEIIRQNENDQNDQNFKYQDFSERIAQFFWAEMNFFQTIIIFTGNIKIPKVPDFVLASRNNAYSITKKRRKWANKCTCLLNSPLLNLHRIKVIQFPFAFLCVY